MLGYYWTFSLYSVDQPSFIFSNDAYLFRVDSDGYSCNLWVFLGSLLPNQKLVLILCL
jgi:hypothetical protein